MNERSKSLNRRSFLKFCGAEAASFFIPRPLLELTPQTCVSTKYGPVTLDVDMTKYSNAIQASYQHTYDTQLTASQKAILARTTITFTPDDFNAQFRARAEPTSSYEHDVFNQLWNSIGIVRGGFIVQRYKYPLIFVHTQHIAAKSDNWTQFVNDMQYTLYAESGHLISNLANPKSVENAHTIHNAMVAVDLVLGSVLGYIAGEQITNKKHAAIATSLAAGAGMYLASLNSLTPLQSVLYEIQDRSEHRFGSLPDIQNAFQIKSAVSCS